MKRPLRFGTFNVHGWADGEGRGRLVDAIEVLRAMRCDALFLNEVTSPEGALRRVADELEMHVAYVPAQWAGNALLCKRALSELESVVLTAKGAEARTALMATVTLGEGPMTLVVTHLDHRSEDARVHQVRRLHDAMGVRKAPCLLAGDLNALRLTDYPPDILSAIGGHRARNGHEGPRGDVVAFLDAAGFVDVVRAADGGCAPAATPAYAAALARPLAAELRTTCWAGTRIDHVWLSPALGARFQRVQAEVVRASNVSDHKPVVVTLA